MRLTALLPLSLAFLLGCPSDEGKDSALPDDSTGDTGDTGGTDADSDGYTAGDGDCDDGNAAVNPGATEACDGVDNNCDT